MKASVPSSELQLFNVGFENYAFCVFYGFKTIFDSNYLCSMDSIKPGWFVILFLVKACHFEFLCLS